MRLRGTPEVEDEGPLLRRLVAGDRAAFDSIYRLHNPTMIRFATAILGSRASAEEVAQETWVAVLRHIGGFEGRAPLAGWIFRILANRARTRVARDGRMKPLEQGQDPLSDAFGPDGAWKVMPELWNVITPERILSDRRTLDLVIAAIEALPAAQRAVLILRGQQGLAAEEVCEMLGLSDGNMRVLLHRARTTLRVELARRDD